MELTAIVVAAFGAVGVLTGLVTQRKTEREKLTEKRIMDLLDWQSSQISKMSDELMDHRKKLGESREANREQKVKLATLEAKHDKLWRLFTVAIESLTEWIRWDQLGRRGESPETPEELREHLPLG